MNTVTVSLAWIAALYATFVVKHFLADFLFQTGWMAIEKGEIRGWVAPLAIHAAIHAGLTLVIALVVWPPLWWLGAVDFAVHAAIDRAKAGVTRAMAVTPKDNAWWWLLGADQALHELTHLGFVLALLGAR